MCLDGKYVNVFVSAVEEEFLSPSRTDNKVFYSILTCKCTALLNVLHMVHKYYILYSVVFKEVCF